MANIDSAITEPPIQPGIESPMIVIKGRMAFLSACVKMTFFSLRPFDLAVVIKS